jgi:hypothetical protein
MPRPDLTSEQHADADALRQHLMAAVAADIGGLAELLATNTERDLFEATEFAIRDAVLATGAKALWAAERVVLDNLSTPTRPPCTRRSPRPRPGGCVSGWGGTTPRSTGRG